MRWIGARPLRRAAAVRETSERGYGNQPYEHWDREHDAGGPGVEPLACSHAGKNGMTIPENPKKGA
jgi:hypothetical protein